MVDVRRGQLGIPPSLGRKGQCGTVQCEVIPACGGVVGCVSLTMSSDVTLTNRSNTRATLGGHHTNCDNVFWVIKSIEIKSFNLSKLVFVKDQFIQTFQLHSGTMVLLGTCVASYSQK